MECGKPLGIPRRIVLYVLAGLLVLLVWVAVFVMRLRYAIKKARERRLHREARKR